MFEQQKFFTFVWSANLSLTSILLFDYNFKSFKNKGRYKQGVTSGRRGEVFYFFTFCHFLKSEKVP